MTDIKRLLIKFECICSLKLRQVEHISCWLEEAMEFVLGEILASLLGRKSSSTLCYVNIFILLDKIS